MIDNFSLGSITPDHIENENILQLNDFINNSINNDNFDNPILTSVINQSTTDNTKDEFFKLLKFGAATTSNLSNDEKYTYDNKGQISGINYNHIWKQKLNANFRFRDDLNIMGYLGTIDVFKKDTIPKLKSQYLEMDFKVDQHGIKVDYLNATIIFDIHTNLIRVCSFPKKQTPTHMWIFIQCINSPALNLAYKHYSSWLDVLMMILLSLQFVQKKPNEININMYNSITHIFFHFHFYLFFIHQFHWSYSTYF